MKVKICGIKRVEDAIESIKRGADTVGLLVGQVHSSNDFIDKDKAKNIVGKLPPFCSSALVTHLTNNDEIISLAKHIGVTTIQLHGDSSPEDIQQIKHCLPYIKIIKSLHVIDDKSIDKGKEYITDADAILLDTINKNTNQVGGTGLTHDWGLSKEIVDLYPIPVILAGGLKPDNIQNALTKVNPYGVDVNSGVKGVDGFKDYEKLSLFISRAKGIR